MSNPLLLYLVTAALLMLSGWEKVTMRDLLEVMCSCTLVGGPGTSEIWDERKQNKFKSYLAMYYLAFYG